MRKIALFGGLVVLAAVLFVGGAAWWRQAMLNQPLSASIEDREASIALPRPAPAPPLVPVTPTTEPTAPAPDDQTPAEVARTSDSRDGGDGGNLFNADTPTIADRPRSHVDEQLAYMRRFPEVVASENKPAATADSAGERKALAARKQALDKLPKGKIVLDAPTAMKVGETRAVHANVGVNVPLDVLKRYVRPSDQSKEAMLSVSSQMAASLTGSGFKITATTPERQGVAEGVPTVWSWDIEAKDAGDQELEAILYVLLPGTDQQSLQRIDSFVHKIGVTVKELTWSEWLKERKEEVDAVKTIAVTLAGAVTAFFGWLGWSYSRRRRNENSGQGNAA
jgi:hypothetical protein